MKGSYVTDDLYPWYTDYKFGSTCHCIGCHALLQLKYKILRDVATSSINNISQRDTLT